MSREQHIWVTVGARGYRVILSGKKLRDCPTYRDALFFIAGWCDKPDGWPEQEETRVRALGRAISSIRYKAFRDKVEK
jgi:hypothetical protein